MYFPVFSYSFFFFNWSEKLQIHLVFTYFHSLVLSLYVCWKIFTWKKIIDENCYNHEIFTLFHLAKLLSLTKLKEHKDLRCMVR